MSTDIHGEIIGSVSVNGDNNASALSGTVLVNGVVINSKKILVDTTANWNEQITYVPKVGDIIVYSDKDEIVEDNVTKYVPGIKIGDGNAYVVDLPFVTDSLAKTVMNHIGDIDIHITSEERTFWNNKLNLEVVDEQLIFNRE